MNSDFCLAVHALVYLNHKACVISSEELADNICTNPARVRKVMAKLKASGLLETREGSEGGYRFTANAERVNLARVVKALNVRCIDVGWRSGSIDKACLVSSGMAEIMEYVLDDLNEACMEKLRNIAIADIDRQIFGK